MLSDAEELAIARLMDSNVDLGDEEVDEETENEVKDELDILDSLLADDEEFDNDHKHHADGADGPDDDVDELSDAGAFHGEEGRDGGGAQDPQQQRDEQHDIEFQPPAPSSSSKSATSSTVVDTSVGRSSERSFSREINFSPGGSGMQTGQVPSEGSFSSRVISTKDLLGDDDSNNGDGEGAPDSTVLATSVHSSRSQSSLREVNFSPTIGTEMEAAGGAPSQGSFVVKPTSSGRHPRKQTVDEEYADEVTMLDNDHEKWKSQKEAVRTKKESLKPTPKISNKSRSGNVITMDDTNKTNLQIKTPLGAGRGIQPTDTRVATLDREADLSDEQQAGMTGGSNSSYVGDVDETKRRGANDIQFQPEGFLRVTELDIPKQGSFHDKSSTMSSYMTNSTTPLSPNREINFSPGGSDIQSSGVPKTGSFVMGHEKSPTSDDPDLNIPVESFVKMGAMMQEEGNSVENEEKDEHDDLLDDVLGDSDPVLVDHASDNFVPDEALQDLEKLLDDGLEHLEDASDHSVPANEAVEKLEMPPESDHNDSMARELDDLLGDDGDEEIEFDFDDPLPPSVSLSEEKAETSQPRDISSTGNKSRSTQKKKPIGVGRIFRPRKSQSNKLYGTPTSEEKSKGKSSIASRTVKAIAKRTGLQSSATKPKSESETSLVKKKTFSPTKRSYLGTRSIARSFMAATKSSARRFSRGTATTNSISRSQGKDKRDISSGKKIRFQGSYMASTFTRTRTIEETEMIEAAKRRQREEEALKIVVDVKPWGIDRKLAPVLSFDKDSPIHSPPRVHNSSRGTDIDNVTQPVSIKSTLKEEEKTSEDISSAMMMTTTATPYDRTTRPRRVKAAFSPRSVGSLTSQCTVVSFVSPVKAGVRGCQKLYDPYAHERRGPCELCMFQLDDEEKLKLDLEGRHLKVMFTTGGCRGCLEFPRTYEDDPPVRLCVHCFSMSHRPVKTRRSPGKGNRRGYSFAKTEYV